MDDELARIRLARPPVRLVPHDPQAAPILVAFTDFPGLHLRFGSWRAEPFPGCGCDACDETADGSIEHMTRMVEAVVSGGFRESIQVPVAAGEPVGRNQSFGLTTATAVLAVLEAASRALAPSR